MQSQPQQHNPGAPTPPNFSKGDICGYIGTQSKFRGISWVVQDVIRAHNKYYVVTRKRGSPDYTLHQVTFDTKDLICISRAPKLPKKPDPFSAKLTSAQVRSLSNSLPRPGSIEYISLDECYPSPSPHFHEPSPVDTGIPGGQLWCKVCDKNIINTNDGKFLHEF